jgi:hypothetical protein
MKTLFKSFGVLVIALLLAGTAQAGQQIYLSTSPSGKFRVVIEQVLERRVGDQVFFRYPLMVVNTRNPKRHFEIRDGGSPLVQETDKGTFKINWDSFHFDWAKDSEKFFLRLEVIEGTWNTFFVSVTNGKTQDITADLEKGLVGKADFHDWGCEQPKVELVTWTKPYLAFLKLTSICGKDKTKENPKLFYSSDSVLYDTQKEMVVSDCGDCKDEKSLKKFDKYFIASIPTPTPTPEETPVTQ